MSTVMDPPAVAGAWPDAPRDPSRDGASRAYLMSCGTLWRAVQRVGAVERVVNRSLIDRAVEQTPPRPYRLSTKGDYTTWETLTDRSFSGRQLPPTDSQRIEPADTDVAALFAREEFIPCPKSTVLFAYFAQWFTDGFLRTQRPPGNGGARDIRRNISTHDVDLAQLYGSTRTQTGLLRAHVGGRLRSMSLDGAEFPPLLCDDSGARLAEFEGLDVPLGFDDRSDQERRGLFAMGSDVANTQIGFAMFNVLFLREHNRVAGELADRNPDWDDERVFQTTRNILVVLLVKLAIEEYINHITPYHFRFKLQPGAFERSRWMRANWESVEFNLLYRWHSLIPDSLRIGNEDVPLEATMYNNELLTERGLGPLFDDASRQPAGRVGLFNSASWFDRPSLAAVRQSRSVRLASYNDYRELCGFPRVTSVRQISSSGKVCSRLDALYGHVDEIELYVGLFAEDLRPDSVLPPLMGALVGVHAFSQLLTNPLLAPEVYDARTFTPYGMELIASTARLEQVVHRNVAPDTCPLVSLTRSDWRRGRT